MESLSPRMVLEQVTESVPRQYHKNIIIIGSLAAAYHFFGQEEEREVRTKDIDCLLAPHGEAIESGMAMAQEMLREGWRHRTGFGFGKPQPSPEPKDKLSAIRLHPPHCQDWFAEFLAVPSSEEDRGKNWMAIKLESGYFGLPTFEFLSVAAFRAIPTEFGIRYARPETMALANLLSHPHISADIMSTKVGDRTIKRSNKDLGRVLSLARLSGDEAVDTWASMWEEALKACFPTRWPDLVKSVGRGFRELLSIDDDFEQAHHTCIYGLLARQPPNSSGPPA